MEEGIEPPPRLTKNLLVIREFAMGYQNGIRVGVQAQHNNIIFCP